MIILTFAFGLLFGGILQYAKLNKFNTISGVAVLKDFAVPKAILIAIGVGAILINLEIGLGVASFHSKPLILGGIILGGLIFGAGMAILGYCPGTLPVSAGEGSVDAAIGIAGGLFGGLVYTILLPSIKGILGPDLGNFTLKTAFPETTTLFYVSVFILGGLFIALSFLIHKMEKTKDIKWVVSGIALAVLNAIIILQSVSDRPIGASTTYPYAIDSVFGLTNNDYFLKIQTPGHWELIFLAGAFVSGLLFSLIRKDFKLVLIHDNWKKYKGNSNTKRIIWAFAGGFLIIMGARMAGGCTSGHIISGGMQLALSSFVFALFVFAGLLVTGRFFYGKK
ncbi:MAG TPA: transporter [Prolixibacteraceae bacterium]|nr:transporter [Prolixibacteraceae bacterium]